MSELIRLGAINKQTNQYTHPSNANKQNEFICIDCGNDVIIRQGKIRVHHFAHRKEDIKCNFYSSPNESQIHKNAKLLLKYILENKIPLKIYNKCTKCNKIDEYDIPEISESSSIVIEYRFDYNGLKIADVAYIEENEILCLFEICNTHKTHPENRPEPWFELDATNLTDICNNCNLQTINLDCIRDKICDDCINQESIFDKKLEKGIIYFNQRGAGCGKTYESIQLIQIDKRFIEKETYIYLTKMHSAKEVIYNELKEQEERGQLNILEMLENDDNNGKQYKISCINKETNKVIDIIIGTIDSFNYAIVDKNKIIKHNNYFQGIVKTIRNGFLSTKNSKINYAGKSRSLNNKCLILIDEAQDLGEEYIEAFNTIITHTNIDVYVIGDKLQSIWGEHNIHTYIDVNNLDTHIERSHGINKVMRFHNANFINFVNDVIPFEKYGLPSITEICDGCCKYSHENNIIPYNIFEVPQIYASVFDYPKIDRVIEKIILFMDREIHKYNYLPNNFMFIFPILSKNIFATMLETRVQNFWINKFNDLNYQKVLKLNEFWKDKINDNKFYKYTYLHKSDEGKSINLKESENASRILSIHSSKGNGCEVVFVLGITEKTLTLFSKKKGNLVYDSLLHVAITRQKKSIYIGIEKNNDDICNRFTKWGIEEDDEIAPRLECIKCHNKFDKVQNYINNSDDIFNQINDAIIEPNNYKNILPTSECKKSIIDWGHHKVRYCVMIYYLMLNIIQNEVIESQESKDQFITILKNISTKTISFYKYANYNKKLREIDDNNKKRLNNSEIPLLLFDTNENTKYYKYTYMLKNIINNIQTKIIECVKINKLPQLCSLECVVILFMIKIMDNGSYSDVSIMDIYSIMYCYDYCSNEIDKEHTEQNKCICHNCFNEGNLDNNNSSYDEIRKSIKHHYNHVEHINQTYYRYKKYITENLKIENMTYNVFHKLAFGKKNKNFTIMNEYTIIGHSNEHVIYFIIKPQFNELNFNNIMCESILNNFMILNCTSDYENNFKRYNNKKIYTCILTLDSIEPIFYELNVDKNNVLMKQSIKKYLLTTYSEHHELIYKFYKYCYKNKPTNKNSINYTMTELNDHEKLPKYISDYFYDISKELEICGKDKIKIQHVLIKVNDKELFINNLNTYLEKNVDIFLEMHEDEVVDY
jgi:hypothetical protein